jgi:hypothetical protein
MEAIYINVSTAVKKKNALSMKKNHVIPMLPKEPAYNVMRQGCT